MLKRGSDSPALSLSLSPRHSDILTFYGIMSKIGEPKVSFLSFFFTLNESRRPSPCRERVVYHPLVAVCRGRGRHSNAPLLFFFLFTRFATSLTFVFRSFSSASRIKRGFSVPSRAFPQTGTRRPPLSALPLDPTEEPDASTVGHSSGRSLSVDADTGSGSQASTLRQQGNFA